MIRVRNVTKKYGEGPSLVTAVDNVSFDVKPGTFCMIMGPSGSGKTTLLSMIGCLLSPTSGDIIINGQKTTAINQSRLRRTRLQEIGFVFQSSHLLPWLTTIENVMVPLYLDSGPGKNGKDRAKDLLQKLGLGDRMNFAPSKLSGGEKQRVAVARSLINDPRLILADEPTGNLDSSRGHEVAMLLKQLASEEGRTVLVVTHDQRIADLSDQVLFVEDGRLSVQ